MKKKVIVVGAGILGASTAYFLAKEGTEVIVVDRHDDGQATDAGAGMICPWTSKRRNKAWYRLAKAGARMYQTLAEDLASEGETDIGYAQVGAISLHKDDEKIKEMHDIAVKRREDAPEIGEVNILDEDQTKEMFPFLADGFKSVYISGAARVDGRKMRDALIRSAKKHGAIVRKGDASLIHENSRVIGVSVDGEVLHADIVLAATGVWMDSLLKPLGINFRVDSQKGQVLHVNLPNHDQYNWPVVMPPTGQYILSFDDRMVIGSTHENKKGFDYTATIGGMYELLSKLAPIAPGLMDCTLLESRVGFRPFTPEYLPMIGKIPDYEGLLVANGLGSSGLTTGPYFGMQLAKLALGQELDIDLADYDIKGALK
ncbi:FAD-binding oxidoreductase [Oceanobacillus piezotolerans]|uniref:FAD-binding oxidoreductase n=1 Tax=Oceanobacillus piezotolerans TaxID=2448030 RepID=A0A498DL57_9BACI|nr:FAD-dependent oxidoreductase [Oceanobacillus piezotolerans]RLL43709.1 FAD-binding oxidoreductase [Oceanobacillus piezotolerans]